MDPSGQWAHRPKRVQTVVLRAATAEHLITHCDQYRAFSHRPARGSDRIVDVIHAHHTAELVPDAELVTFDDLGHFSITTKVVPAISNLLQR